MLKASPFLCDKLTSHRTQKHTKLKLAHSTLKVLLIASSRTTAARRFLLSLYVQVCWIQVALHLLGSWLLTAYILLSYDCFLSILKHFRPSDVVSVRNNNGFWWGSVSEASLAYFTVYSLCIQWTGWQYLLAEVTVTGGRWLATPKEEKCNFFCIPTARHGRVCDIS